MVESKKWYQLVFPWEHLILKALYIEVHGRLWTWIINKRPKSALMYLDVHQKYLMVNDNDNLRYFCWLHTKVDQGRSGM